MTNEMVLLREMVLLGEAVLLQEVWLVGSSDTTNSKSLSVLRK